MKTEQKLIQLLKEIVSNQDYLFDEGTIEYLLGRLPEDQLMQNNFEFVGLKNFRVQTNLMGFILAKNSYKIQNKDFDSINQWLNLLSKKTPTLIDSPQFTFIANGTNKPNFFPKLAKDKLPSLKGNFSTFYSLMHFENWITNQNEVLFGDPLNKINGLVFTLDALANEQRGNFFFKDENKTAYAQIVINHVIQNKSKIIENNWHDDSTFTSKVMTSNLLKRAMVCLDSEQLEPLFSPDSLGIIIRQANDFNNLKLNHQLLNNLLALAPADKWLQGWKNSFKVKTKELNIIELFNNKFFKAYGLNIIENKEIKPGVRKETFSNNKNCIASFKDEFSFFLPEIKNMTVSNEQHIHLFNAIMRTNDVDLMSLYRNEMEIPPLIDNKNEKIYNIMMNRLQDKNKLSLNEQKWSSWMEYNTYFDANKLNYELSSQVKTSKRTLKI
jgi:hypothetical protein